LFEGSVLDNIDPYTFLPDPNCPVHNVQDMEFVGWVARTSYIKLLRRERDNPFLFNTRYLQHTSGYSAFSHLQRREDAPGRQKTETNSPVDVIWMYIDLIPSDWGLGDDEFPEKWLFGLAADEVIIAAAPTDLEHDEFPLVVTSPDYDGYSTAPLGRIEIVSDIQTVIDFLYNSHIFNIRKVLNDMLVVDPYMVNIYDLQRPGPGRLIRTRRAAWGRGGVGDHVKQLEIRDVTASNIDESQFLENMARHAAGATDEVHGVIKNRGPRISATQASNARVSGLSRLEKLATIIALQSMNPLARLYAFHTQQLMTEDTWVRIAGEMEQILAADFPDRVMGTPQGPRVRVSPEDLRVNFDLQVRTAIVPGSEDVSLWVELLQVMLSSGHPGLIQGFDIPKIFKHIARQMGAKNIDDFIQRAQPPQVLPDEEVARQEERGNLVPVEPEQGNGQL
jgi:hypothetical protein